MRWVPNSGPVFHIMKFLLKLWAMIDFDLYHLHTFTPLKLQMGAGVSLLRNQSTIALHNASGDIIDERCGLPREVIVTCKSSKPINAKGLTEVWSREFSAVMRIPLNECISFTWSKDGHLSYNVLVVFIPLSYESPGYIESFEAPWHWPPCCVCAFKYDDDLANYTVFDPRRDHDCSTCDREYCCRRCKVELKGGAVKCYHCLTEEEYEQAKKMYSGGDERHRAEILRLSLLLRSRFNVNACSSRSSSEASAKAGP